MRLINKISIGVFLLIVIISILIINQQKRRHNTVQNVQEIQNVQEDELFPYLKDGDIIYRLGDRLWSIFFKELSPNDKKFSHLGIIRIRNDTVSVIHAEGSTIEGKDCVNEVSLKEFLIPAQRIGIYRLRTISGDKISDTALKFLGHPFDWQFDMNENDTIYCSELLYAVLNELNSSIKLNTIWIKEIKKYVIPLDIYTQTEYFEEVGYWGKIIREK